MLQHFRLKVKNSLADRDSNLQQIRTALSQIEPNSSVIITLQVEEPKLARLKKLYYSMVGELGKHAGYIGREDRELFKEQVKKHLQLDSIAHIDNYDRMLEIIEELHLFAQTEYGYVFNPFNPIK